MFLQRLFQQFLAKAAIVGVGYALSQNVTGVPVNNGAQVHEALIHWNVGDVGTPDLVVVCNLQIPKQVEINLVLLIALGRFWLRIDGGYAHILVITCHTLAADAEDQLDQVNFHPTDSIVGSNHELPVYGFLNRQLIKSQRSLWLIIKPAAAYSK